MISYPFENLNRSLNPKDLFFLMVKEDAKAS
jgi:hypothetical protein